MDDIAIDGVEDLLSALRQGRMIVLLDDDGERYTEGVVAVAAEHCEAGHITFMARRARGLVCLAITRERSRQLALPPMVEGADAEHGNYTLSIEAARGIETGISASDRAHTVRVAVAPQARPDDIVQPGHIFPVTAEPGGVLRRAGHAEAAVDATRLAGLTPAAVLTSVLDSDGGLAGGRELVAFAREHGLKIGTIADLIQHRLLHERTIERVRRGRLETIHGPFALTVYRDSIDGELHLALARGAITLDSPTLVRVDAPATLRDLLGSDLPGGGSWSVHEALARIAAADKGVLVLLARSESEEQLLHSVDRAFGEERPSAAGPRESYSTVGVGSQILRDLGVGQIHLLGTPVKYNALSGFGLEVLAYLPSGDDRSQRG